MTRNPFRIKEDILSRIEVQLLKMILKQEFWEKYFIYIRMWACGDTYPSSIFIDIFM